MAVEKEKAVPNPVIVFGNRRRTCRKYIESTEKGASYFDNVINALEQTEKIMGLKGVRSCVVYQKAASLCSIPKTNISEEVNALGGLGTVAGSLVTEGETSYLVQAPIVIMDDAGFREYCGQIGNTQTDTQL